MPSAIRLCLLLTTLGAWACAGKPAPAPPAGAGPDARALVGAWAGEYTSEGLGQSGSLTFTLAARGDTARGDVIMIPRGLTQPLAPAREAGDALPDRAPAPLTITLVRVTRDQLDGSLAPYADAECGCTLYTSLVGRIAGDAISGSFMSINGATGTMRQRGTWRVTRVRAP